MVPLLSSIIERLQTGVRLFLSGDLLPLPRLVQTYFSRYLNLHVHRFRPRELIITCNR